METLERLLNPQTIAVIGGGAWCEAVIEQNIKMGFQGYIWPIHPSKQNIAGLSAFKSLADLPNSPDAAFIGVNRHATVEIVRALAAIKAGGAICFASGFKEADDGDVLNRQLLEAAGEMPILGPNCYGILNTLDNVALWPDQHGLAPLARGVAIIAQSSNIAINLTMQQRGLPIAYAITVGNQTQQSIADIAQHILRDKRVTALGLYIESFGDIRAFESLAQLANQFNKPVVALKVGRSQEAQQATISHTASLSGSAAGADALMARLGIASVSSLAALLETLKIFHCYGRLSGTRITSLSCSGGEASVMADTAARYGLSFPAITSYQESALKAQLSALVHLSNPLDYHTQIWRNKAAMQSVFAVMTGPDIDITLIVLDFPRHDRCNIDDWLTTVEAIEAAALQTGQFFGVVASLAENMPEEIATRLLAAGIVPLCDFDASCEAIRAASCQTADIAPPILQAPQFLHKTIWQEAEAKASLAQFGMAVPNNKSGLTLAEITKGAEEIGFPIVLKGEGLAHKTEAGAVVLNLNDAKAALIAAQAMEAKSFMVEEMVQDGIAELLIGIVADPAHGFVLTIGAGGALVELLADRQSLLIPASPASILSALQALRIAPLLNGYRGAQGVNLAAIVACILQLQDFVLQHSAEIAEIEINPLICTSKKAVIADALLVKGNQ